MRLEIDLSSLSDVWQTTPDWVVIAAPIAAFYLFSGFLIRQSYPED